MLKKVPDDGLIVRGSRRRGDGWTSQTSKGERVSRLDPLIEEIIVDAHGDE